MHSAGILGHPHDSNTYICMYVYMHIQFIIKVKKKIIIYRQRYLKLPSANSFIAKLNNVAHQSGPYLLYFVYWVQINNRVVVWHWRWSSHISIIIVVVSWGILLRYGRQLIISRSNRRRGGQILYKKQRKKDLKHILVICIKCLINYALKNVHCVY